jgi:hypothetical protein
MTFVITTFVTAFITFVICAASLPPDTVKYRFASARLRARASHVPERTNEREKRISEKTLCVDKKGSPFLSC